MTKATHKLHGMCSGRVWGFMLHIGKFDDIEGDFYDVSGALLASSVQR